MKNIIWGLGLIGALAGCATTPADPTTMYIAQKPLICKDKAQCDIFWQRAQAWVGNNSGYKIQTVSDSIIQTYGPLNAKVELAHLVTKVPNNDGSAQIFIKSNCANMFGCQPDRFVSIARFKTFVSGE